MDKLLSLCVEGIKAKGLAGNKQYVSRMLREYNLIRSLGYVDYMLVVWDIVHWARMNGIMVGVARGSVAGSLVAYLIGITGVDPIKHGLLFERFMNSTRSKTDPPDIDVDFQASKRHLVKQYIVQRYGEQAVCDIGAYSRNYASSAIKDVARFLGLSDGLNEAIAHKLYDLTLAEAKEIIPEFNKWVIQSPEHDKCFRLACALEGIIRHKTIHPSGVVITNGSWLEEIPVHRIHNAIATQWKDTYIGKAGWLKLDILGLALLDIYTDALQFIGEDINFSSIPLDDGDVLAEFNRDTTGIFQFDTNHQSRIAKQYGIRGFEDLVIVTTISRPASYRAGITDSIIRRRHKKEAIQDADIAGGILADTYGYPIYQELVMQVANKVGNISLEDTELMRDAIKHFKTDVIQRYKDDFIKGAISNGYSEERAKNIWSMIQNAGSYTFNKAHAVSYSLMAYWGMWMRTYYPLQYLTACLRHAEDDTERSRLLEYIKKRRINVWKVDVNYSDILDTVEGNGIRLGLCSLKGIGEKASQEIVSKRPYTNRYDFVQKVDKKKCNAKVVKILMDNGAI